MKSSQVKATGPKDFRPGKIFRGLNPTFCENISKESSIEVKLWSFELRTKAWC